MSNACLRVAETFPQALYVMKVWWALCDTVQLRIISALVLISHRVALCNMKENAVFLLKTNLSIVKYLTQELAYLLA